MGFLPLAVYLYAGGPFLDHKPTDNGRSEAYSRISYSYFRLVLLLALALPPLGQGLLLIPLQALFGGLFFLLDVYVIEVWPTEVTCNLSGLSLLLFSGSQLWLQHVGECQQDGLSACSTSC